MRKDSLYPPLSTGLFVLNCANVFLAGVNFQSFLDHLILGGYSPILSLNILVVVICTYIGVGHLWRYTAYHEGH